MQESARRREERAKRFGLRNEQVTSPLTSQEPSSSDVSKLEARSERFGTETQQTDGRPVKMVESLPPVAEGRVRCEAVHLYGVDDMSTRDVFKLFSVYGPRNIEWINDKSCECHVTVVCDCVMSCPCAGNVVWEDQVSARRALNGVGHQPLAVEKPDKEVQEKGEEAASNE